MARITVDDCLHHVPNRFQMTLVAAYRARQLSSGTSDLLDDSASLRDKPTVTALREISLGKVGLEILESSQAPYASSQA